MSKYFHSTCKALSIRETPVCVCVCVVCGCVCVSGCVWCVWCVGVCVCVDEIASEQVILRVCSVLPRP